MNIYNCLLLDTANIDDIRKFLKTGMFGGVTTNPSLIAKESKSSSYMNKIVEIAQAVSESSIDRPHLSIELISDNPDSMVAEALTYSEISLLKTRFDLYFKVPVSLDMMPAIRKISDFAKVNATACMTSVQALMAQQAGAQLVSFFYNRIRDQKEDPRQVLAEFRSLDKETKVICGSIRYPNDIFESLQHGADYVTIGPKIAEMSLFHPQTKLAIEQFHEDIKKWQE